MQCKACSHRFSEDKTFIIHMTNHRFLNSYECGYMNCSKSFNSSSALKKHLANYHVHYNPQNNFSINLDTISVCRSENSSSTNQVETKHNEVTDSSQIVLDSSSHDKVDKIGESEMQCLLFVTKLYKNDTINRSVVQEIIDNTSDLLSNIFSNIKSHIHSSNYEELNILLSKDLFETCNSEYKRFKLLENSKYFIKPTSFFVGNLLNRNRTSAAVENKPCEGQIIPLRKILQKILEIPTILNEMLNFKAEEEAKENEFSSIFNTNWWKSIKPRIENKLVLPIYVYFDDFETGNPLGTQAGVHKLGGVYVSFAATPPKYSSRLENIFLWGLFYSSDRVMFSNKNIFQPFINELKFLESEGIIVERKRIFFIVPLLLGDNLGINSITGMTESFSSIHFCRACTSPKTSTQNMTSENQNVLRNKIEYTVHLNEKSFGVKEYCPWNDLSYFHNTENVSFDIMHDIYEGICRYEFGKMLKYFIFEKEYFTLDKLNNRIKHFDFTEADIGNKFPPITPIHVEKQFIIMSSSEMHAFVTYFGMLVYDLIEPSDEVWQLYLLLFNIVHLVSNNSFSEDDLIYLDHIISDHHELYINIFKCNLTPKHHFLLHYSRTIKQFGPLSRLSSIRYEAFHKISKSNANVVSSRRNIPLTLSIKHQLRLAHRLISNRGFSDNISIGTHSTLRKEELNLCHNLPQIENTFTVSWLKINGIIYKPGFIIQVGHTSYSEPKFGKIKKILYNNDENIKFVYEKLLCCGLDKSIEAYEIIDSSKTLCDIIDFNNCHIIPTSIHVIGDGCKYITSMNQE